MGLRYFQVETSSGMAPESFGFGDPFFRLLQEGARVPSYKGSYNPNKPYLTMVVNRYN